MSASLVGSEMCIRDRFWEAHCDTALQELGSVPVPEWKSVYIRRELDPVSYTHLTLPTICSV
eukprot:3096279-Alexandrium_andersonii.AAC.1